MPLFPSNQPKINVPEKISQLRQQGLTDDMIINEMKGQGVNETQVISALSQINNSMPQNNDYGNQGGQNMPMQDQNYGGGTPQPPNYQDMPQGPQMPQNQPSGGNGADNIYERIEEITEGIIDEKWDELIAEVRKIIDWKDKMTEKINRMDTELGKLKEDFKTLHQGVLGKMEDYDNKMQEVGTELKAVGKVFKDVVPVFTENVKELKHITSKIKEGK
ncbi:hypothetical protein HN385_00605 [archaeon]|jgi:hypothetical protein|nr:hypothetical protein [archaeon]MBT3451576.1 hypothetical protein [archaeon]MBT6869596.1 hypothetical protein [archaeon]MBT7192365.1 hypothetical protein [archaeon]MBT7380166.1 hypothetical protein [archaeon]